MSLFAEVYDLGKGCPVVVNLEHVVEITPLRSGGCEIAFSDSASVGGKRVINVRDNYDMFKQLAMTIVTPEAMSDRIAAINKFAGVPQNVPKADSQAQASDAPRGRGRPPKVATASDAE
jgi:hypothetical protein